MEKIHLTEAIAACLASTSERQVAEFTTLVARVLADPGNDADALPARPSSETLQQLAPPHADLRLSVDLVYGGPTRIKEYVFESPKLPEIRGASALLDDVTNECTVDLWRAQVGGVFAQQLALDAEESQKLAAACVIYASGGNFLAIAPTGMGKTLAPAIEQLYADWTLTATSAAVWSEAMLIELRYGRLRPQQDGSWYWREQALQDWADPPLARMFERYYYVDDQADPTDRAARFYQRKNFGELVSELTLCFYRRREEQAFQGNPRSPAHYALLPTDVRCDSSGLRPATWEGVVVDESRQLSTASARKRFIGQIAKGEHNLQSAGNPVQWFLNQYAESRPASVQGWATWVKQGSLKSWQKRWEEWLPSNSPYWQGLQPAAVRPATDVGEIAASSRRYLGMIYADGNNVARYMGRCQTPSEYAEKAGRLSSAAKQAVFTALAEHLRPTRSDDGWVHPFEILTIGGDDLLLLVPGDQALTIALRIGWEFEQSMRDPQAGARKLADRYRHSEVAGQDFTSFTPEVGLSAAVVIGQENAPIFFLERIAEQLLANAKRLARKRKDDTEVELVDGQQRKTRDNGGAVDFMVLRSITMITDQVETFRAAALGDQQTAGYTTTRLTCRPYSWHEFAGLLATTRALQSAGLPRSQVYRLRAVLEQARDQGGITASAIEYLATRSRYATKRADAFKSHVELPWRDLESAGRSPISSAAPPWLRLGTGGWETIWPDIAEIYDMVHEEPANG